MTRFTLPALAVGLAFAIGCSLAQNRSVAEPAHHDHGEHAKAMKQIDHAIAVITPTEGNSINGTVRFEQDGGRVIVIAELSGLPSNTTHGFHVHEFGDISAADGTATGGHYNPDGVDHALPHDHPRHAGDLGNITADADGNAVYEITVDNLSIAGTNNPIIGRGLIIHAKPDDGSQPTGNAGARIGQGVIGIAE